VYRKFGWSAGKSGCVFGKVKPRPNYSRAYHWERDSPESKPHRLRRHKTGGDVRRAQETARSDRSGNCRNPQTGPRRAEPKATTAASTIIARRTGKNDNEKCVRKHAAVRQLSASAVFALIRQAIKFATDHCESAQISQRHKHVHHLTLPSKPRPSPQPTC
jgi:hypothetical protein